MNNKSFLGLFLVTLLLLPGCMRVPIYRKQSLQPMRKDYECHNMHNDVVVHAKYLTSEELQSLFGARAEKLEQSVDVVYVSLYNGTDQDYFVSLDNNNFAALSYQQVAKLIKTSSVGRLAFGVVNGVGTSVLSANVLLSAVMLIGARGIPVGLIGAYGLFFALPIAATLGALPFFGKCIKSAVMNGRIKRDLKEKILPTTMTINSGDYRDGLMFVKALDYTPQFTVVMHEEGNAKNTVMFDVDLQQN